MIAKNVKLRLCCKNFNALFSVNISNVFETALGLFVLFLLIWYKFLIDTDLCDIIDTDLCDVIDTDLCDIYMATRINVLSVFLLPKCVKNDLLIIITLSMYKI